MSHYFDDDPEAPSAPVTIAVDVGGTTFEMETDRGVFSHGQLDAGTKVLLDAAPPPAATGRFVDVGCGAGALALVLALHSPGAEVVAVDVNARARALCARNAARLGLRNVSVVHPDETLTGPVDLIWSNPPIRIGKAAVHDLLVTWLEQLSPAGDAFWVVHKNLGADSLQRWLNESGWPTRRLASSKGYRVLHARRSAPVSAAP